METTTTKTEGLTSKEAFDVLYEAMRCAGKVGGYIEQALIETMTYAGKTVAYILSVCSGLKAASGQERYPGGNITILHLVRGEGALDEADQREFYMNFGRDLVELTKAGVASENLMIIDLSKYGI
jgi:hypothetical protein